MTVWETKREDHGQRKSTHEHLLPLDPGPRLTVLNSPCIVSSLFVDWAVTLSRPGVPASICSTYKSNQVLLLNRQTRRPNVSSLSICSSSVKQNLALKGFWHPSPSHSNIRMNNFHWPSASIPTLFIRQAFPQIILKMQRKKWGRSREGTAHSLRWTPSATAVSRLIINPRATATRFESISWLQMFSFHWQRTVKYVSKGLNDS